MIRFSLFSTVLFISSLAAAEVPEPKVDYASVYQGYATITGVLVSQPNDPVGITIKNGGLTYSTVTDAQGKWGLVIRLLSSNYSVASFDLRKPGDHSLQLDGTFKN